jgi:anti-sigma B factor antagonist
MKTEHWKEKDFIVLSVDGNIILEETATLKDKVEEFIENDDLAGIVLNCKNVKFIDSSGLGLIVSIYKTLTKRDKKFALTNLNQRTMEIFILTKLDKILTITETDEAAIEALS